MDISSATKTSQVLWERINSMKLQVKEARRKIQERTLIEKYTAENEALEKEINQRVKELNDLERKSPAQPVVLEKCQPPVTDVISVPVSDSAPPRQQAPKKEKPKKEPKAKAEPKKEGGSDAVPVDVSLLDMRVGKIVEIQKHPEADSLYVEKIDIGSGNPITVVSGLVKHIPLEELQNSLVIVLCNLKPAKMRGITSEGMVMCASTPEKVEVLRPPSSSSPGTPVAVPGYPSAPRPLPIMNPKKKIFETVAPDLMTNDGAVAAYKGVEWVVEGHGPVKATSLKSVQIK